MTPPTGTTSGAKGAPGAVASEGRGRVVTAFYVLGALFFGLAVADRLLTLAAGFSSILLTVFIAWLLTFLVAPAVAATQRRLGMGRGKAVALVYLAVLMGTGVLVAATTLIGAGEATDIVARSDEITARIHELLASIQTALGISTATIDLAATYDQAQHTFFASITSDLNAQLQAIAGTAVTVIGDLFLVVTLSLYATLDFDGLLGGLRRVVPNRYREELQLVEESVGHAFGGFLRAQIILVLLQAAITIVIGVMFGLPYLYLITVGGAIVMFVPFFGPTIALLPPILDAIVFRPEIALPATVLIFVVQVLLIHLVQPRLMKERMGIHPILVLVALLLGAQVAGVWGALFGIPIVAVADLLIRYVINRRAVQEVEGIDLEEVVAEIQQADPDVPRFEAVSIAADRAEALEEDRTDEAPATSHAPATRRKRKGQVPRGG